MRKLVIVLAALTAAGVQVSSGQTSRGAFIVPAATKNFTPIEKVGCRRTADRWCGPFHNRVCSRGGHCVCVPCAS
jgi:hypothetical protein